MMRQSTLGDRHRAEPGGPSFGLSFNFNANQRCAFANRAHNLYLAMCV
jgi:hypothetical protein